MSAALNISLEKVKILLTSKTFSVEAKGGAVYRLPFLPLFFDRFYRFTVYRFFAQKAVKNGKNLH